MGCFGVSTLETVHFCTLFFAPKNSFSGRKLGFLKFDLKKWHFWDPSKPRFRGRYLRNGPFLDLNFFAKKKVDRDLVDNFLFCCKNRSQNGVISMSQNPDFGVGTLEMGHFWTCFCASPN